MKIIINDHRKIFAIQKEFTDMFPNLRIEFFARPSKAGSAASTKLVRHSTSKKLLDCRVTHKSGVVELFPSMTVQALKDNFSDVFGLTVEILREPSNGGSALSIMEKLSLEELNNSGVQVKL